MKNTLRGILAAAVVAAMGSQANAATITVNANPGTLYTAAGLTQFTTDGNDMVGMLVAATIDNVIYNGVWASTGANSGAVVWNTTGNDPELSLSGDSFFNSWELNVTVGDTPLQKLSFSGAPGRTVFDRTNPSTGTPGSDQGSDFGDFCTVGLFGICDSGSPAGNIVATYSDLLQIGAAAPLGDVYVNFAVDFTGLSGGGLGTGSIFGVPVGTSYRFTLDTDNALPNTVIVQSVVPEPTSMALVGVAALFGLSRRLRRRA